MLKKKRYLKKKKESLREQKPRERERKERELAGMREERENKFLCGKIIGSKVYIKRH